MMRLMLISCSSTKCNEVGLLPAIDRYQGTTYKVINKAKREGYWLKNIHVYIVSAKYGLISGNTLIELYNRKMTKYRALELQFEVSNALDTLLRNGQYDNVFINMGAIYMQSISSSYEIERVRQAGVLQEAVGGIGQRQKQTKEWIMRQHFFDLRNSS